MESGKEGGEVAPTPSLDNKSKSFQWRGGQKRQTTGIWMWSEPFIRSTSATNGEKIAILLMDTQGMFDNETTMTLTAQIFGLSTLVSSFQVYNVCRQIQEDNLQHLALFSEYGRMALMPKVSDPSEVSMTSNLILSERNCRERNKAIVVALAYYPRGQSLPSLVFPRDLRRDLTRFSLSSPSLLPSNRLPTLVD